MIIDAIDSLSYVPRLLAHQQGNEFRGPALDALEALAGRCQVRIFADGRIVDVKKSASGR
ncbi:hypothetical protein WEI85_09560 [Actinomycetes bacterium KLBMP 9797]